MRIVVAGGSGFIGKALRARLAAAGHEVTVVSLRPGAAGLPEALEGAHGLVNLAGESIADGRWTPARKAALRDSRILTTQALVSALSAARRRPQVFVSGSAVGYYGDRGDEELTERSSAGDDFLAKLCLDWESEALKAEALGVRVVRLRTGVVLGRGGGALAKMLLPFKLGVGGPLGSGRQWMSWISLEDEAGLIEHVLAGGASGAVNATAPHPVTNRDFTAALGSALRRPAFLPAPAFALRLALGEMAGMLLGGQKVLPEAALAARYSFQHPTVDAALAAAFS